MRYLLFWDIWSADPGMRAYFKLKDHQIIGTPHGATILDRIIKNEEANQPPPAKSWMKPRKSKNAPFCHPHLSFGGEEV